LKTTSYDSITTAYDSKTTSYDSKTTAYDSKTGSYDSKTLVFVMKGASGELKMPGRGGGIDPSKSAVKVRVWEWLGEEFSLLLKGVRAVVWI
jgi:hypothetical protein